MTARQAGQRLQRRAGLGAVCLLAVGGAGCLEPNLDYRRPEVLVPAGMGPVGGMGVYKIAAFYLDVFEVRVSDYRLCVQEGGCTEPRNNSPSCNWSSAPGSKEDHPINCIDWAQADNYCRWSGRRLPTEAEWEYAAGGPAPSPSKYPWGAEEPTPPILRGCFGGTDGTCPSGQYPRTLLGRVTDAATDPVWSTKGVADLAGNVYEWTSSELANPYMNPAESCDFMKGSPCSLRGGSWLSDSIFLLVATRNGNVPTFVGPSVGARCARTP